MISPAGARAAIIAFMEAGKGNVVGETEASNRANICLTCPLRAKIKMSLSAHIGQVMALRVAKHNVPEDIKGYKCGVCLCPLALLVPAKGEHLHTDSPEEARKRAKDAPRCWLPAAKAAAEAP